VAHGGQLDPTEERHFEDDLDKVIGETHWVRPEWRRPW
jgi:hypothetical protein